jgi:surfeit locus 1 family protein
VHSFRPAFWPTVTALPLFLILLGLGVWQLERLHWKEALIAQRTAALAASPAALPADLAAARGMEYHPVRVHGEFLNDHELFLGASSDAGTTGFHVITPLRLGDGALLLVDRGWIPGELKDPAKREAGELVGPVDLEGLVRLPTKGWPDWMDWALPVNDCARNYWFWIDIPAMARCGGLDRVLPFTVDAGPAANPGGYPRGGVTRTELPNDHLQYAITWFALAVVLAVIFVVYHSKLSKAVEPPP